MSKPKKAGRNLINLILCLFENFHLTNDLITYDLTGKKTQTSDCLVSNSVSVNFFVIVIKVLLMAVNHVFI